MRTQIVEVAGRPVGPGHPPMIVAELSANHLGSLESALAIIDAAAEAGADAIKLQTYTADTITIDHHGPGFDIEGGPWDGRSLYELYQEAHTPWDWHKALFERGREHGLAVFSSPFDNSAIDFLEQFDPPAYKIASFECIDLPLIRRAAATGKPLLISTGMANLKEISDAIETAVDAGDGGVILLHCVSGYPTPPEDANLRTMELLADAFNVPVGLSDHTLGTAVPIAAVTLGATLIEKHVTMRRSDGGPDAGFSLEPDELRTMVDGCQTAFSALGRAQFDRAASETANVQFRRSLYIVKDVAAGDVLDDNVVRSIRPGFGLPPKWLPQVLGCRAARDLSRGTPLDLSCVAWGGEDGSV